MTPTTYMIIFGGMKVNEYKSLLELLEKFRTDSACVAHLEKFRWPVAIVCPCCGSSRKIYKLTRNDSYKCADCHKQFFSFARGTLFKCHGHS